MLRAPSLLIMPSGTNRIVSWMDEIESGWSPGGVKYRAAHAVKIDETIGTMSLQYKVFA